MRTSLLALLLARQSGRTVIATRYIDQPTITRLFSLLLISISFGCSLNQYDLAKASSVVVVPSAVGEDIEETGLSQSIQVSRLLLDTSSPYQRIQVYEAAKSYYGRILVLDGVLQLAEGDAAAYNEMMAHVALFQHPNPRRVLVIGGGDGYVVSEVLKHASVQHVDHVDLDERVIEVCKEYFPEWNNWNNPRVQLHITDGAAYCRSLADLGNVKYDVIIQDSSDPWTITDSEDGNQKQVLPSSVLYTQQHLRNINQLLEPNHGVFVFQAEMLQIPSDLDGVSTWRRSALDVGFSQCRYGSISVASYPTGQIGFLLCEKNSPDPQTTTRQPQQLRSIGSSSIGNTDTLRERFKSMSTKYYHPGLQTASFVLPLWAEKAIYGNDHPLETTIAQFVQE